MHTRDGLATVYIALCCVVYFQWQNELQVSFIALMQLDKFQGINYAHLPLVGGTPPLNIPTNFLPIPPTSYENPLNWTAPLSSGDLAESALLFSFMCH